MLFQQLILQVSVNQYKFKPKYVHKFESSKLVWLLGVLESRKDIFGI